MINVIEESDQFRVILEVDDDGSWSNPLAHSDDSSIYVISYEWCAGGLWSGNFKAPDGVGPHIDLYRAFLRKGERAFFPINTAEQFARHIQMFRGCVAMVDGSDIWYTTKPEEFTEPRAALASFCDEYTAWANGEVYGYAIQERCLWKTNTIAGPREHWEWETHDSCWGFIGYDYAEQTAREEFKAFIENKENSNG